MLSLTITLTLQRRRLHFKSGQATANKSSLVHVEVHSCICSDNPQNICERVTTTTLEKYDAFVMTLTDVQWLLYLQDHSCYCMLFDTSRCDHFTDVQCMITDYKILVVRWSGKLPLWLCYAINKIYITTASSANWNQGNHSVVKTTTWFLQYLHPPVTIRQILSGPKLVS